ncbi:MAG: DUF488 domain-containing protein [Desulfobulbus sp.]
MNLFMKRVYEPASDSDGTRVLVDRIWPRGLSKDAVKCDLWLKDVAPSTGLRKWFGHDPEKWTAFQEKYRAELKDNPALTELQAIAAKGTTTLVFAAKDTAHCHALVLHDVLLQGK